MIPGGLCRLPCLTAGAAPECQSCFGSSVRLRELMQ